MNLFRGLKGCLLLAGAFAAGFQGTVGAQTPPPTVGSVIIGSSVDASSASLVVAVIKASFRSSVSMRP